MATFLEQSIEWQKKQIAELTPQIATAKAAADQLYGPYRAMRGKIADAKANPNTTPEQLAALVAEQDRLREEYFTAREKQESLENKQAGLQSALADNQAKLNDPQQNVSFANGDGTTTAAANGQDPNVNRQTDAQQNANSLPNGQTAQGFEPPSPGADPAFLEANAEPQGAAVETPPVDEFEGVDEAVAANENALKEPPVLSDDEVDAYLSEQTPEELGPPLEEPPVPDGETGSTPPDEPTGAPTEQSPPTPRGARGLQGSIARTRKQATAQDLYNYNAMKDWRVKLQLAPNAKYLYKARTPGILTPLAQTNGVVFPYTPQVQTNYIANYQAADLIHTNYKIYQYQNSSVDSVSITCDFTAQDTFEANYVLAVIHFFRSVTKMFYGKDQNPVNGTPPPLCYLTGYGQYQFNGHPLAITNFTYSLPNDVDYIRCTSFDAYGGDDSYQEDTGSSQNSRAAASGIGPGGTPAPTKFNGLNPGGGVEPTYVPTRLQIQVQGIPIISRGDVSQNFSLRDYATGKLLQGNIRNGLGGGFW